MFCSPNSIIQMTQILASSSRPWAKYWNETWASSFAQSPGNATKRLLTLTPCGPTGNRDVSCKIGDSTYWQKDGWWCFPIFPLKPPWQIYLFAIYAKHLLHQTPFYTRHVLHQTTFTTNNFYTRHPLHQKPFYTRHLLHKTLLQLIPIAPFIAPSPRCCDKLTIRHPSPSSGKISRVPVRSLMMARTSSRR